MEQIEKEKILREKKTGGVKCDVGREKRETKVPPLGKRGERVKERKGVGVPERDTERERKKVRNREGEEERERERYR